MRRESKWKRNNTAIKGKGAYKNGKKITVNDYELDDMKTVGHYDL